LARDSKLELIDYVTDCNVERSSQIDRNALLASLPLSDYEDLGDRALMHLRENITGALYAALLQCLGSVDRTTIYHGHHSRT